MKKVIVIALIAVITFVTTVYAELFKNQYPTWTDVLTSGTAARAGATAPSFKAFRGGIYQNALEGGATNEELHFSIQFPHSYKEQSTIDFHVHTACSATGAGGNNIVDLCVEYEWVPISGTFSVLTTTVCATFQVGNPYIHNLWEITDISGIAFGTGVSSIFVGRLYRNKTGGRDNYTGDVFALSIDLHFIQDMSGSFSEYSK